MSVFDNTPWIDSPYERGDADAYYGREPEPHYRICAPGKRSIHVPRSYMTLAQVADYLRGYEENPSDKKDWR